MKERKEQENTVEEPMENDEKQGMLETAVSIIQSFVYLLIVCWVIPVIPIVFAMFLKWPVTMFLALWVSSLPVFGVALYILFKTQDQ
jgi:hypothetical protein